MIQALGQLLKTTRVFVSEQEGATATEYAVILILIIGAVAGTVSLLGFAFSETTSSVSNSLIPAADQGGTFLESGSFRNHTNVARP